MLLALMEGRGRELRNGAHSRSWNGSHLTASKETGTLVLQLQGTKFYPQPE